MKYDIEAVGEVFDLCGIGFSWWRGGHSVPEHNKIEAILFIAGDWLHLSHHVSADKCLHEGFGDMLFDIIEVAV